MKYKAVIFYMCFLFLVFLSSCTPNEGAIKSEEIIPTFEAEPPKQVCRFDDVCIKQAHVFVKEGNIFVDFELVNPNGKVEFGDEPMFWGNQLFAIFLVTEEGETYLAGFDMPEDSYSCYAGNDIPWANGQYASTCGFGYPISKLQIRPEVGDIIRVANGTFDFSQTMQLIESNWQ